MECSPFRGAFQILSNPLPEPHRRFGYLPPKSTVGTTTATTTTAATTTTTTKPPPENTRKTVTTPQPTTLETTSEIHHLLTTTTEDSASASSEEDRTNSPGTHGNGIDEEDSEDYSEESESESSSAEEDEYEEDLSTTLSPPPVQDGSDNSITANFPAISKDAEKAEESTLSVLTAESQQTTERTAKIQYVITKKRRHFPPYTRKPLRTLVNYHLRFKRADEENVEAWDDEKTTSADGLTIAVLPDLSEPTTPEAPEEGNEIGAVTEGSTGVTEAQPSKTTQAKPSQESSKPKQPANKRNGAQSKQYKLGNWNPVIDINSPLTIKHPTQILYDKLYELEKQERELLEHSMFVEKVKARRQMVRGR